MRHLLLASAFVALATASPTAHDMWIEPTAFLPATGQIVGVKLRVGQDLLGDPIPRDPTLINQFVVDDGTGRKPVVGRDGTDPAGYVRIAADGLTIVGYQSNPSAVQLAAEKFNSYLAEEGLDAVASVRTTRRETMTPARELFSRCAKTLMQSGSPGDQGDRALGFTLELVAERNPYTLRSGDDLPVRLTYERRPLAGALVVAINRLNPADKLTARSDADGRAHFRLKSGGVWLIKAVHMIPAPRARTPIGPASGLR